MKQPLWELRFEIEESQERAPDGSEASLPSEGAGGKGRLRSLNPQPIFLPQRILRRFGLRPYILLIFFSR
ncbi:MAG: hypothetical protein KME26_31495 [Oscillatoria princeps RMCB-10]|nr:hypothetical protein [Oscillatoria princeps RMCB-10]